VILPDGTYYDGEWIIGTDIREGKARIIYKSGILYDGWVKQNESSIRGRELSESGQYYEGEWENDMPNGQGTFKDIDGY